MGTSMLVAHVTRRHPVYSHSYRMGHLWAYQYDFGTGATGTHPDATVTRTRAHPRQGTSSFGGEFLDLFAGMGGITAYQDAGLPL